MLFQFANRSSCGSNAVRDAVVLADITSNQGNFGIRLIELFNHALSTSVCICGKLLKLRLAVVFQTLLQLSLADGDGSSGGVID